MNYCQDGIKISFGTETQEYTYNLIYGHYEIQPSDINDRPYFKMGTSNLANGIWWSDGMWYIGPDWIKGTAAGFAYVATDKFCPNQLPMEEYWYLYTSAGWKRAKKNLLISCK